MENSAITELMDLQRDGFNSWSWFDPWRSKVSMFKTGFPNSGKYNSKLAKLRNKEETEEAVSTLGFATQLRA